MFKFSLFFIVAMIIFRRTYNNLVSWKFEIRKRRTKVNWSNKHRSLFSSWPAAKEKTKVLSKWHIFVWNNKSKIFINFDIFDLTYVSDFIKALPRTKKHPWSVVRGKITFTFCQKIQSSLELPWKVLATNLCSDILKDICLWWISVKPLDQRK